jgi:predicted site-specific integrase-resolvase
MSAASRTLRRYTLEGKPPVRDVDALKSECGKHKAVGYERVSFRRKQAGGDLDGQVARLHARAGASLTVYTDVACELVGRPPALQAAVAAEMRSSDADCEAS